MLPPDQSPIHQLVQIWRGSRLPTHAEIPASRARLFEAATHEIIRHANRGTHYDPMTDQRFLWATQWLQVADCSRNHIDPETTLLCNLLFDPAPFTSKHLQANDLPQSHLSHAG